MDVIWESPPTIIRTGRTKNAELELAAELRAHPDQWARMIEFEGEAGQRAAGQLATLIRAGKRAAFRTDDPAEDGEFEAVSRKIKGSNLTAVYVRYATLNND